MSLSKSKGVSKSTAAGKRKTAGRPKIVRSPSEELKVQEARKKKDRENKAKKRAIERAQAESREQNAQVESNNAPPPIPSISSLTGGTEPSRDPVTLPPNNASSTDVAHPPSARNAAAAPNLTDTEHPASPVHRLQERNISDPQPSATSKVFMQQVAGTRKRTHSQNTRQGGRRQSKHTKSGTRGLHTNSGAPASREFIELSDSEEPNVSDSNPPPLQRSQESESRTGVASRTTSDIRNKTATGQASETRRQRESRQNRALRSATGGPLAAAARCGSVPDYEFNASDGELEDPSPRRGEEREEADNHDDYRVTLNARSNFQLEDDYDENDEGAPAEPTAHSQDIIQKSFRFAGCSCDLLGSPPIDPHACDETRHSLASMADFYANTCSTADVLDVVRTQNRLPVFPAPADGSNEWRSMLAGTLADDEPRLGLSLEKSCCARDPGIEIHRTWDIDFFAVPHPLSAFKGEFQIAYITNYNRTITQDWHLRLTPHRLHPAQHYHLLLGKSRASADFNTYVFFPNMRVPQRGKRKVRKPTTVPHALQKIWVEQVLLPSLRSTFASRLQQYHPPDFNVALDRCFARQDLNVLDSSRSVAEHYYDLPYREGDFESFEQAIRLNIRKLGPEWQDPQFLSIRYNCKNVISAKSIQELRPKVKSALEERFHYDSLVLEHAWVDLAYSDSAIKPREPKTAYVLARRSACNLEDMRTLQIDNKCQLFGWHGTSEAGSIRATPPFASALRQGGVAYAQAYNVSKNMFASIDRSTNPLFGEPAFSSLGYSDAVLREFHYRRANRLSDPDIRKRARKVLKTSIHKAWKTIRGSEAEPSGFSARQEYRVSWPFFMKAELTDAPLCLAGDNHWPYWVFEEQEVLRWIYWETNRWLHAVCAVLSPPIDNVRLSIDQQHQRTAMLGALFACLELSLNGQSVQQLSRLAKKTYHQRGRQRQLPAAMELWKVGNGVIRMEEENGESETEPTDAPHDHDADLLDPRARRGLDLADCLERTGMIWLPGDMFDWHSLRFKHDILEQTAFANGHYRRQFGRHVRVHLEGRCDAFLDRILAEAPQAYDHETEEALWSRLERPVCQPLWQLTIFRYCNWILRQLAKGRLPRLRSDAFTAAERCGVYGLSYDLLCRASPAGAIHVSPIRGSGGQSRLHGKRPFGEWGFAEFPPDHPTRIQLLFDWNDGFNRKNWSNNIFRRWTQRCARRLEEAFGEDIARRWQKGIGPYAQPYLPVLPKYEQDKMYSWRKNPNNNAKDTQIARRIEEQQLLWYCAVPLCMKPSAIKSEYPLSRARPDEVEWAIVDTPPNAFRIELLYSGHVKPRVLRGLRLDLIDEVVGQNDDDEIGSDDDL